VKLTVRVLGLDAWRLQQLIAAAEAALRARLDAQRRGGASE
jgi:hypothetical protein